MGLLDFLKETVGIDAGSQNLRIIKDGELVFNERCQISYDKVKNVISGLGNAITETSNDVIIKPVNCAISDFQGFEMLLRGAIRKGSDSKSLLPKSYIMYYCIPTSTNEIEKRAYRDSGEHVGAVEVHMVYQSICSAVGMNLLFEKKHFIIVDFGSSKIELTIFANSLIISEGVVRVGTLRIFRLLRNYLRRKYKIEISDKDIELLLTSFNDNKPQDEIRIQYATVKSSEVQNLLDNFFNLVNDEFIEAIEGVSGHSDIGSVLTNGIFFTGGGSIIEFLRNQIKLDNRIKRTVSENPTLDNINGLKEIIKKRDKYKNYIMV